MTVSYQDAQFIFEAEKQLVEPTEWKITVNKLIKDQDGRNERYSFEARVLIGSSLPRGV